MKVIFGGRVKKSIHLKMKNNQSLRIQKEIRNDLLLPQSIKNLEIRKLNLYLLLKKMDKTSSKK